MFQHVGHSRQCWTVILILLSVTALSKTFHISAPDTELKLKILELQKFANNYQDKTGVRDKRQSFFEHKDKERDEDNKYTELFGHKLNKDDEENLAPGDKLLRRNLNISRVKKIRKKARFPRRSYGSDYEAPKDSYTAPTRTSYASPRNSYEAPSIDVSTHRPSYATKSSHKSKPFTSFRSIGSSSSSRVTSSPSTYSVTAPSYSAPSTTSAPKTAYYSPPKSSYSSPPKPSYSSPPKSSYSSPKASYSSPSSYSSPKSSHSSAQPSYSSDSPGEYSYSYEVPERDLQAWEKRSGYSTQGSYSVLLPDGRTMTVSYTVPDTETGFIAEVSYQGTAQYPQDEYKPSGYNFKREAKIESGPEKEPFQHFKALDLDETEFLERELGLTYTNPKLPLQILPVPPTKNKIIILNEALGHVDESKYGQHQQISTSNEIEPTQTPSLKFPSFEPKTLPSQSSSDQFHPYREFSTLNPRTENRYIENERELHQRQHQIRPQEQKSSALQKTEENPVATPIFKLPQISQESYKTKFQSSQPTPQMPVQPPSPTTPLVKTNIQPFVYFPTSSARSSFQTNSNNG